MNFYFILLTIYFEHLLQTIEENYKENYWETIRRNNFNLSSLLVHVLDEKETKCNDKRKDFWL